jgi:putative pyruvate formate lyase activating enzyme
LFCQNYTISQEGFGRTVGIDRLAQIFIDLQNRGAHNINLVSPAPYVPAVVPAISAARRQGLTVPVVYNTHGYETVTTLRLLDGLVDIYLPDLKYGSEEPAQLYSAAPDYFPVATAAIKEMYRQTGAPVLDENGLALRGTIIRHLVLPGHVPDSLRVLHWIAASIPRDVYVSLMAQYFPAYRAVGMPPLNRCLTPGEYRQVMDGLEELGLENGYIQELDAASDEYVPTFDLRGIT